MRAALEAKVPRVVYVSTCAVFGNTGGKIVDETYGHQGGFPTFYEETKHEAHLVVKRMIEEEHLPAIIVMPGGTYGPGDTSQIGNLVDRFVAGKLPAIALTNAGFTFVHVDDVAEGIVRALDKGRAGESYVLGGQVATVGEAIDALAKVAARKPPRFRIPTTVLKMFTPFGSVVGPLMGFPPNLRELIAGADGVTYWASHEKASRELGYEPRTLEEGLRDMLVATGKLST
jgi:nucleoside-diphosphate-sugar epimerase